MDLVAVLVMAALALTGLLTPAEAQAGFGNPVVITVVAVFVLSTGLARTGGATHLLPSPDERLQAGDTLLVDGADEDLQALRGLQALEMDQESLAALDQLALESDGVGLALGLSPRPFLMLLAVAVVSSALNPVSHPANVLIMGPGGYRFGDFLKVGIPLALLILAVSLAVVPLLWPFAG